MLLFLIAVDESHSGDSSIDLFADEQLLHHKARHFRPVIRAWSVPPKPKTEAKMVAARNSQSSSPGLSDSAHLIKTPEPIPILAQTTENTTGDHRTTPTPIVMDHFKVINTIDRTKPQSIIQKAPSTPSSKQAQDILLKSSNQSHTVESTTASKLITSVPTSAENITNNVNKTSLKVDASQTGKPFLPMESMTQIVKDSENTPYSITPSPAPQKPPATMTHSNTFTATESTLRSTADTRATIMMTSRIDTKPTTNPPKMSPTHTETSGPSLLATTSPTTTSTSKPGKRKYSISWDEEVQPTMDKPSVVKKVMEENFEESSRKSGRENSLVSLVFS